MPDAVADVLHLSHRGQTNSMAQTIAIEAAVAIAGTIGKGAAALERLGCVMIIEVTFLAGGRERLIPVRVFEFPSATVR